MKNIKEKSIIGKIFIKNPPRADLSFVIIVIALAIFGTVMVFSAGGPYSLARYGDSAYFMKRQIIWLILGFLTAYVSSHVKPEFYKKITPLLYAITILLLLLVLVVGFVGNGAKRWISIGPLTIQPSEIAKIAIVLMLAKYFSDYESLALEQKKRRKIFSRCSGASGEVPCCGITVKNIPLSRKTSVSTCRATSTIYPYKVLHWSTAGSLLTAIIWNI